jgi:hypothetical protein
MWEARGAGRPSNSKVKLLRDWFNPLTLYTAWSKFHIFKGTYQEIEEA